MRGRSQPGGLNMQTKNSHFNDISYQAKEFVIEEYQ